MTFQFSRYLLDVHEITKSAPGTGIHLILPTASLSEISYGRQFGIDGFAAEPAVIEILDGSLGVSLAFEPDVDVSNQMITKVITDIHLLNRPVFVGQFHIDVLEELVKVPLVLLVRYVLGLRVLAILRVFVEILQQYGLGESWSVMDSAATVAMSASPNLEIERAVDFVFLGSENGRKIVGHDV